MKKVLTVLLVLLLLTGCNKTDAERFKEEYESMNNKEVYGQKVRNLTIDSDNNIVYKSASDIIDMINNKETFVVYFGFKECPWCRSVLPSLLKVSKDLGLESLYYVDISELRDTIEINDNNELVTTKEGGKGYSELLKLLDPVLDNYTIENNGDIIDTGEKRIYAPNVISVVEGVPTMNKTGESELLTDPYMELTEEIENDIYNIFKCVIKCVTDKSNTCQYNKVC